MKKYELDINKIVKMYNDDISIIKIAKSFNVSRWVIADRLKKEGITIVNKWNRRKLNSNYFDNIDNENKAYWLGFLYADGYVSNITNHVELSLQLSDINHLKKFKKDIEFEGKIYVDSFRCRISLADKYLNNSLQNKGCIPNKSLVLKYPKNLKKELERHFIRGYFDGDGHIKAKLLKSKVYSLFASLLGTKEFINKVLEVVNIDQKLSKDKRHSGNTFGVYLRKKQTEKFLHFIYKDSKIHLDRKYNKYLLPSKAEMF